MEDVTPLLSLREAKLHLRVTESVASVDADIQSKLDQATAIILDYLGPQADDTWDEETVPGPVHTAILLQLAHLYAFRGDDLTEREHPDDDLAPGVKRVLRRYRDPVVA